MNIENIKRCLKNDRFARHTGIELLTVAPGHATAKLVLHPHHQNGLGTVQGGAIFTLADFCFAAACNSHGTVAVALNVSITFMKAATTGTLWAEAKEVSKNFKVGAYAV
jgi:acyl-CoA thioesterase